MQIIYNQNKCIGCNACVVIDSQNWELNANNGKVILIDGQAKKDAFIKKLLPDEKNKMQACAKACPTRAIRLSK